MALEGMKVVIVGDHPWTGFRGTVQAIEKPSIGILPVMARVRLDDDQDCPYQHECYVSAKNMRSAPRLGNKNITRDG